MTALIVFLHHVHVSMTRRAASLRCQDDENEHEADEGNEDVNQVPGDDDDEPDEDLEPEQEAAVRLSPSVNKAV